MIRPKSEPTDVAEHFRHIYDKSPLAVSILDRNGIIVEVNAATERLIGYSRDELVGKQYLSFVSISPDEQQAFLQRFKQIIGGELNDPLELKFITKKGKTIWLKSIATPIRYEENTYMQCISIDSTANTDTELKLRKSESKYRHLFEDASFGILLLDSSGIIIDVNPQLEKDLGYSRNDLVGADFFTSIALPKETLPLLRKRFQLYLQGEKLDTIELQIIRNDGEFIWVNPYVSIIQTNGEKIIQIIIKDITEKKQSELNLKESLQQFRTITEQSFMGITLVQDYQIKYANQHFLDMTGYSKEDLLNWPPGFFLTFIHPEDREMVAEQATRKQEGLADIRTNYNFRGIKKDGSIIYLEIFSKPINYFNSPAILVSFRDISKQIEAEELIQKENKKLKELDRIRKEFIDRITHELKSPLTAIYGASQLLMEGYGGKLSENDNDLLRILLNGSNRIKKLTNELLEISRLESEEEDLEKKRENLSDSLKHTINELIFHIKERQLSLKLDITDDLYSIVNIRRIEQVFNNIIHNAIKNTPTNGLISIKLEQNGDQIKFTVKDSGVGIEMKDMDKLFKQFSRIERDNPDIIKEGTGLGLYISKKIVKMHNGSIIAESEGLNKGATFTVFLPINN